MKINDFKGVFVPPVKKYYLGKLVYGTPYFWPIGFNKNIISIRRLIPKTQAELEKEILDYPHYYKREKFKNQNNIINVHYSLYIHCSLTD